MEQRIFFIRLPESVTAIVNNASINFANCSNCDSLRSIVIIIHGTLFVGFHGIMCNSRMQFLQTASNGQRLALFPGLPLPFAF